ncbi:MAG TPA: beta-L-arabinofuranosidase domain-containing protein [Tepidisphaeraceae bacterium]|nr:beta-L-arabinofuranosidase domain-containing protein [Tepidisphaeraceae bacterium]
MLSDASGQKRRAVRAIPFTAVAVQDGFWSPRMETNRTVTIPFALRKCEETGRIDNFAKAGRLMPGAFAGRYYDDSDVFKVIEGAAYSLANHPDEKLDRWLDEVIEKIAAAQEPDGYLYTNRTIDPNNVQPQAGPARWSNLKASHELYNVGHLYEAAVAHFRATSKRSLLDVALKNAELIAREFGPEARHDPPGHQEIEIGLARLYDVTGDRRFLELSRFFLDQRGRRREHRPSYGTYAQDHKPVTEQDEVVGHAVRALYMYCGMADVAALTGEDALRRPLDALWEDMVGRKLALTGGVGARKDGESFGNPYEQPNATSYNETCAAIANVFWQHRMFLLSGTEGGGDARYLDVLERTLYNGLLAGVSLSGDRFFYVNPLASDGVTPFNYGGEVTRAPWFACSCCPVNVARFLASLGGYIYAGRAGEASVNLFVSGRGEVDVPEVGRVVLRQETRYPWDGQVRITVEPPRDDATFALRVRVPGWAQGRPVPGDLYRYVHADVPAVALRVNGAGIDLAMEKGMAVLRRAWRRGDCVELALPMLVRRVVAHEKVKENAGHVALERGPIVYCAEAGDNPGVDLANLTLPDAAAITAEHRPNLLGGVTVLGCGDAGLTAIPYYAWSHRGAGAMAVWLKRS